MGNSLSTFIQNLENSIENLFGSTTPNEPQETTENSNVVENDNTTLNKNLTELNEIKNGINTDLNTLGEDINDKLQKINYLDNSIKINNELLQLVANRSNKNLSTLEKNELEIATKGSIVSGLNSHLQKQRDTVSFLLVILAMVVLLVIPLVLMIVGKISKGLFMTLFIIDFILICLFVAWKKNFMYLNSFVRTMGSDLESTAENTIGVVSNDIQNRINSFNKIVRADVYGSEADFQSQYCCPDNNSTPIETDNSNETITDDALSTMLIPGLFYNDGSAPSQLLVPNNTRSLSEESNGSQIYHPDFAMEDRRKSLIKNRERPILDRDDRLIGETTNTVNL